MRLTVRYSGCQCSRAEVSGPMTPEQVKACINGVHVISPTKPYRVDFKFDGKRMVRVGSSPGAPK